MLLIRQYGHTRFDFKKAQDQVRSPERIVLTIFSNLFEHQQANRCNHDGTIKFNTNPARAIFPDADFATAKHNRVGCGATGCNISVVAVLKSTC